MFGIHTIVQYFGSLKDSFFSQNSLLIKTNGINNSQNNIFLDSGPNNLTITKNGNVTQGSVSPFNANGWSGNFTAALSSITGTVPIALSTSFTIEAFIYPNALSDLVIFSLPFGNSVYFGIINGTFGVINNGDALRVSTTAAPILRTWNHIALVRDASKTPNTAIFLNGIRIFSGGMTSGFNFIGSGLPTVGSAYNGNISNFRVLTGVAAYDVSQASIAVPRNALTAIAGTSLLTLQNRIFKDNSPNNALFTKAGTPTINQLNPFALSETYSPTLHGGSAYFDGSGDYLITPAGTSIGQFTGDFTIEGLFYFDTITGAAALIGNYISNVSTDWMLQRSSGQVHWFISGLATFITVPIVIGSWHHIACVRVGSTCTLYLDGVATGGTKTLAGTVGDTKAISIGSRNGIDFFSGKASNIRIDKSAIYTTNFVSPASPVLSTANTTLLLNFTNASVYDASCNNDIETLGTAKVSTSVLKYSTSNMYFDGTSNSCLKLPANNPVWDFGAADFTLEFWYYKPVDGTSQARIFNTNSAYTVYSGIEIRGGPEGLIVTMSTSGSAWEITSGTGVALALNTWNHIALVRSGTTFKLYLNGTLVKTLTSSAAPLFYNALHTPTIGGTLASYNVTAYIEDFRVTKGTARYLMNFTPPTAALAS